MENIDWDKAPEGATHHMAESSTDYECWLKKDGDRWFCKRESYQDWMNARIDEDSWWTITERPSPSWNGEGLPPVGFECEANFVGNWVKFELRYYGEAFVVFKTAFEVQRKRRDFDACGVKFRPIRTPEQIAADEREAAVAAMLELDPYLPNTSLGMMSRADFCRALHNAGYRKQDAK